VENAESVFGSGSSKARIGNGFSKGQTYLVQDIDFAL
jgi:hypothetical protein